MHLSVFAEFASVTECWETLYLRCLLSFSLAECLKSVETFAPFYHLLQTGNLNFQQQQQQQQVTQQLFSDFMDNRLVSSGTW